MFGKVAIKQKILKNVLENKVAHEYFELLKEG